MPTESGFNNQKAFGNARHKTIHSVGSDKFAENVITKGLVENMLAAIAITGVVLSEDKKTLTLTIPAHLAKRPGDVLRFYTGALATVELDILSVPNANTVTVWNVMEALPAINDTVKTAYFRTPQFDSNGSIVVTPGPIAYDEAGTDVEVSEDTPLPVYVPARIKAFTKLDFAVTPVDSLGYTEFISTVGVSRITKAQIFMSSGEPLILAFGAAAAEVDQGYIIPGGNGLIEITIPAGTRLSVKAVNVVTVNEGIILANLLG